MSAINFTYSKLSYFIKIHSAVNCAVIPIDEPIILAGDINFLIIIVMRESNDYYLDANLMKHIKIGMSLLELISVGSRIFRIEIGIRRDSACRTI